MICFLKILSVVTIFYIKRFFQYFWAAVVAEVEALHYIWRLEHTVFISGMLCLSIYKKKK